MPYLNPAHSGVGGKKKNPASLFPLLRLFFFFFQPWPAACVNQSLSVVPPPLTFYLLLTCTVSAHPPPPDADVAMPCLVELHIRCASRGVGPHSHLASCFSFEFFFCLACVITHACLIDAHVLTCSLCQPASSA